MNAAARDRRVPRQTPAETPSVAAPPPARWTPVWPALAPGLLGVVSGVVLLESDRWLIGAVLWAAGVGLIAWAWRGGLSRALQNLRAVDRRELLAVGGLVIVGAALRLWNLDGYPSGFHVDEAAMGLVAYDALQGRGIHPFGFGFIGDPAPFMYVEAAFLWLMGVGVAPLRAVAGLAGAAGLLVLWVTARQMFGARVALIATALVTFSSSHLHFSRMALNIIEIPLFGILGIGLAWRGLREAVPGWHVLAGYALGLSQFANFGARAFVVTTAGTYFVTLLTRWRQWREIIGGGLLALLGMLVVMAPQLAHVRDNPGELYDRLRFRSVFRRWDQATEIHGTDDPVWVMIGQAKINLLAFFNVPDRGPFFEFANEPLLFWPVAILAALGLLIAVARCWQPRFATLLLVTVGVWMGGILSSGAPQFHRLLPLVPVAALLAAISLEQVMTWGGLLSSRVGLRLPRIGATAAIILPAGLIGLNAAHGLHGVFVRYPDAAPWQPQSAWARWVERQPAGATILIAGAPDVFAWDERLRLLAAGRPLLDLPNPSADLAALDHSTPTVVALNPKSDDWVPLFQAEYPGATFQPVRAPDGDLTLLEATLPARPPGADPVRPLRGEIVVENRSETRTIQRSDTAIAFRETSRLTEGESFDATWTGQLMIGAAGKYRFEVFTDGTSALLIDGKSVAEGRGTPNTARALRGDIDLTAGSHRLELRYRYVRGPGILELRWQPPGNSRTVIPPSAFGAP